MRIGSLILAGGRSIRMGQPKESLPFRGSTLLGQLAAVLQTCTEPVVVVARGGDQQLPPLPPGVLVVEDERPDGGPLWGLRTGLQFLRQHRGFGPADAAFVGACDAPFVTAPVVAWLAERLAGVEVVMPRVAGVLQPLAAVYRTSVLPTIDALLARNLRSPHLLATAAPTRLVDDAELAHIDPYLRCVENCNTPAEYAQALARAASSPPAADPR